MTARQQAILFGLVLGFVLMYLWRMYEARRIERG